MLMLPSLFESPWGMDAHAGVSMARASPLPDRRKRLADARQRGAPDARVEGACADDQRAGQEDVVARVHAGEREPVREDREDRGADERPVDRALAARERDAADDRGARRLEEEVAEARGRLRAREPRDVE